MADKVGVLFCNRAEAAALTSLRENLPMEQLAVGLVDLDFKQFVISDDRSPALVQERDPYKLGSMPRHWIPVPTMPNGTEELSNVGGGGDAKVAATIAHYL